MICVPRDEKNLADIEALVERAIPRMNLPEGYGATPEAAETTEEKPARTRSRSRSRSRGDEPKTEETVAEPEVAADAPTEEDRPVRRERDRNQDRDRDNRRRDRKDDNKVVGMGDHMPSFIALSFDERRAG